MTRIDARMTRRTFTRGTAAVTAGLAAGIPAGRAVLAQDASPIAETAPGLPPLPEGAIAVATGLFSPRFLALGDDSTLVSAGGLEDDQAGACSGQALQQQLQAVLVVREGETARLAEHGQIQGAFGDVDAGKGSRGTVHGVVPVL